MKISMSLRLCNEEGEKIFGKGVAQLLRLIDKEGSLNAAAKKMILSILVDTFISKISLTMQPGPKIDSISGA